MSLEAGSSGCFWPRWEVHSPRRSRGACADPPSCAEWSGPKLEHSPLETDLDFLSAQLLKSGTRARCGSALQRGLSCHKAKERPTKGTVTRAQPAPCLLQPPLEPPPEPRVGQLSHPFLTAET